jgi:xylose dehydrogenase (NAD/NADP)
MIGIGVIGARSTVARLAVLPAIVASTRTTLAAAASLSGPPSPVWSDVSVADYQAVLDHPDVDAVYIPLPNAMHEEWTVRAAAAGKHVLCEKPIAASTESARRMRAACDEAGVLLAEAWMTPFDPRWAELMRLATLGLIGNITEIRSTFTFTIGPEASNNYRWDPAQGGGALLDVGIYCLGPAVQLWGSTPSHIDTSITPAASSENASVDAATTAILRWGESRSAQIRCSFIADEEQRLELIGSDGTLLLEGDAHTGGIMATQIVYRTKDGTTSTINVAGADPYLAMVDAFAAAVAGEEPWERPIDESLNMLRLIEKILETS